MLEVADLLVVMGDSTAVGELRIMLPTLSGRRVKFKSRIKEVAMSTAKLDQLEAELDSLPLEEQWSVFERLGRRLRSTSSGESASFALQMAEMASDPDIQREIREIDAEFAHTLRDGLRGAE